MDTGTLLSALTLALASTSVAANAADAPQRIVLPTDVVPVHYSIAVVPDAAHMSFTGSVQIGLDVKTATRQIQLYAADLKFGKVSLSGVSEIPSMLLAGKQDTATFTYKSPVSAGHPVLSIDYSGIITQPAAGFFALDYD